MKHWEAALAEALERVYGAQVARDAARIRRATEDLALAMGQAGALHDLAGRLTVYGAALQAGRGQRSSAALHATSPTVPAVPFEEAFAALMARAPSGAVDAAEVQQLWEEYGFAAARAATREVAAHVQESIARGFRDGRSERDIAAELAADVGWTRGYSAMVFRTTTNSAIAAGRMLAVSDPTIKAAVPAFEFLTAGDRDVRSGRPQDNGENHAALHGYIAAVDSPVWDEWSPPGGFSCRCSIRPVSRAELIARRMLDSEGNVIERPVPKRARFAPGFGGTRDNPVLAAYRRGSVAYVR